MECPLPFPAVPFFSTSPSSNLLAIHPASLYSIRSSHCDWQDINPASHAATLPHRSTQTNCSPSLQWRYAAVATADDPSSPQNARRYSTSLHKHSPSSSPGRETLPAYSDSRGQTNPAPLAARTNPG